MQKEEILSSLKQHIFEDLPMDGIAEEELTPDVLLFDAEQGLGLDSLDAVELVTLVEKYYGVSLQDSGQAKQVFQSLRSIADFIFEQTRGRCGQ